MLEIDIEVCHLKLQIKRGIKWRKKLFLNKFSQWGKQTKSAQS